MEVYPSEKRVSHRYPLKATMRLRVRNRPNRMERGIGQSLGNRNLLLHGCAPGHWIGSRDTSGNAARNQR